jgi:hypothetical protein
MKTRRRLPIATLVLVAFSLAAGAAAAAENPAAKPAEVTLTGEVQCAMCLLKKPDAKGCQAVLVVADKGVKTEYYLAKNAASDRFGMACVKPRKAAATGTVTERDGKKWLAASKVEELKG